MAIPRVLRIIMKIVTTDYYNTAVGALKLWHCGVTTDYYNTAVGALKNLLKRLRGMRG